MLAKDVVVQISRRELAELEGIAHHSSDFVTMLVYHVSLPPQTLPVPESERVMILTGVIANTEAYVKKLLWRFGRLDK
jgi:hypothetical protein